MKPTSLREMKEWSDWDGAAKWLAVCLGLMPNEPGWGRTKHVFWSDNPIGNVLQDMLERLVQVGVLESRDEPDKQYRWNPKFRGTWEETALS